MQNKITFNFSYPCCLGSGKYKDFTNFLSSNKEYVKLITHILYKMIPEISSRSLTEISKISQYHTHPLDSTKTELAFEILKQIVKNVFDYDTNEADIWVANQGIYMERLWQISCPDSNGIRIVGFYRENIFHILFIDYYHLMSPDKNYNQQNYMSNNYAVLKEYDNIGREKHEI